MKACDIHDVTVAVCQLSKVQRNRGATGEWGQLHGRALQPESLHSGGTTLVRAATVELEEARVLFIRMEKGTVFSCQVE